MLHATGTLVSKRQRISLWTLNTRFYLGQTFRIVLKVRFMTQDGQEITAAYRTVIAITDLALFQIGMNLPVQYNPQNPQKIVVDLNAIPNTGQ